MSWEALLKLDTANIFTSPDAMPGVEEVTLKNANGDEEVINVPVFRDMADDVADAARPAPRLRVFLNRTEQRQTIDKDTIRFAIAWDVGGTVEDHYVAAIEKQDAAGWLLRLR